MVERLYYRHFGTDYVFVEAWDLRHAKRKGDDRLARATGLEARHVVEAVARAEPRLFERVCRLLDGDVPSFSRRSPRSAGVEGDARVERVLAALGLERDFRTTANTARLLLLRPAHSPVAQEKRGSAESARIDRLLEQLREDPVVLRGQQYQLAHGVVSTGVRYRDMFETLREEQLLSVLAELVADPATPAARKTLFAELRSLAETQRQRTGRTDLLLLRRERSIARVVTERGPALTPSQLQRARERHWIAVETVDEQERPVPGVRLELVPASGGITPLVTDELGVARLEQVAPGDVTIRVVGLEHARWRALGGAPAQLASARPTARVHVVRQGENLATIADRHGFKGWSKVWQHAANEALRARRRSPHVLMPGDVVAIPSLEVAELVRPVDAVHRLEVSRCALRARFRLQDLAGSPLADLAYACSYRVGEAQSVQSASGSTDSDGWLDQMLPLGVATLTVETRVPRLRFVFDLGHLHPARDSDADKPIASGVQRRLEGLGYRRAGARSDSDAQRVVAAFQRLELREEDAKGALDAATLDALELAYTV